MLRHYAGAYLKYVNLHTLASFGQIHVNRLVNCHMQLAHRLRDMMAQDACHWSMTATHSTAKHASYEDASL